MARRLVDNNARREQRRQAALLDRLEVQFRNRLQRELAAAMREMVRTWLDTQQVTLPRGFHDRIEATYRQMALASVTMFGMRILDQGKALGLPLETKESFAQIMTRLALRYVENEMIRRRIVNVEETTRQQIVNAVARGYSDGLGQVGVADYILDLVPSISAARAGLIARTETHGAANFGSNEAAKQTGLPLSKEWLAGQDERTRETHAEAGRGPPIGMNDTFTVGDAQLEYPGDPAGPPEEIINCRCSLAYVVDEEAFQAML